MRRRFSVLPLAIAVIAAVGLLSGSCDGSPFGNDSADEMAPIHVTLFAIGTPISTLVIEVTADDIQRNLVFNLELVEGVASGTIGVPAGESRTFDVTAFDDHHNVTHTGSATADVNPGSNPPLKVKMKPVAGEVDVTVTFGDYGVLVSPSAVEFNALGATEQLAVTVLDQYGEQVPDAEVVWATAHPTVASVSPSGLVTALANGAATIVATYAGVAGVCQVTVLDLAGQELCDGVDNDGDGEIDEDFDFLNDPDNCGACGAVCASGQCVAGQCAPALRQDGEACTDPGECVSGCCPADDLVCCSTSCEQTCYTCWTGTCLPVLAGTDPDGECPAGWSCDGAGSCVEQTNDADGDGFTSDVDCNDAASSCTTDCSDTDADGIIDCLDLCIDGDGDGYGTDNSPNVVGSGSIHVGACTTDGVTMCSLSGNCIGDDCDDGNGNIFPGQTESCNGLDDDCDGNADEDEAVSECSDALSCTTDACLGGSCVNAVAAESCSINDACYAVGTINPLDACLVCDPAASQTSWSSVPAGTPGCGS